MDEVDIGSRDVCVGYERRSVSYSGCFYERNISKSCIAVLTVIYQKDSKQDCDKRF